MTDAISIIVNLLDANWSKSPKPSIEDIANLDRGDGKRVRLQDKDVIRIFETAHNEAQPELLYDFVNEHINLTLDIRTVKSRERLSVLRNEVRRILHGFRKGDNKNIDRIIFKTRTDLSDRSKKLFRYTMQCEVVTFSLTAGSETTFINPETNQVSGADVFQSLSTTLTEISLLTPTNNFVIVGNGNNWVTQEMGDITAVVAGTGLSGGGTAGSVTLNVSGLTLSELAANSLQISSESFADNDTTIMTSAAILDKIQAELSAFTSGVDLTGGTGILVQNELNTGSGDYSATIAIDLKDEDNMASNSATHAASQQSIKAYVDSEVSSLIDSAPGALDTLNELAAAINDDSSFASTITTSIATKLAKTSNLSDLANAGTARTNLGLGTLAVESLANPLNNRVITSTGSGSGLNAEANLTFDGTTLTIGSSTLSLDGSNNAITGLASFAPAAASGTNAVGVNTTISGGNSTGSGAGGSILFKTAAAGSSGSSANTLTTRLTISSSGAVSATSFVGALTGNADTATTLATARSIGGVSFDGSASITLPGVNATGNQDTSGNAATATALATARTIHGVSFNGTGDIDLSEVIQDTVGAMFSSNTESGITVTYQDGDGTIDLSVASQLTLLDEDNFASNSATSAASQQSIKAYVDNEVAGLIDSAPAALNTLNELAAALGDNASFSTTTATALGNRLRIDVSNQGLSGTQQGNALTNLGITASLAEINILDDGLVAGDIPSLATSKITSGTFADGRISASSVQQHITAGALIDISSGSVAVDLSEATEATVAVADDYFLFLDGGATGAAKKEAIADFVAAIAGSNLTATNGVLASTDTNTQLTTEQVQDIIGGMVDGGTETNIAVTYDDTGGKLNFVSTDTNTQLTTEQVQDIVGAMFTSNTETRISVTYEDGDGTIDLVVDDMTADTNTQLSTEQVQDIVGAMVDGGTETNIAVTYDDTGGKLNFVSSDTDTQLTAEQVQDIVGAMFTGNTETNITATYEDSDGTIDLAVGAGAGISTTDDVSEGSSNLYFTSERVDDRVNALLTAGSNVTLTYDDANNTLTLASTDTNTQYSVGDGGLTQNNFTNALKTKLDNIAANANNYSISSDLVDEDDMASNSATKPASQQSIKAYIDSKTASIVDSAPDALDTLNELAAALGDDANFATTTATSLGQKLVKSSNLSDLTSASTARTNLGLGSIATLSSIDISSNTNLAVSSPMTLSGDTVGLDDPANLSELDESSSANEDKFLLWDESASAWKYLERESLSDLFDHSNFNIIAVSGQSNIAADSTTDTLTLVAGSNVTITTDASTDTVTFASTDTNTNQLTTFTLTGDSGSNQTIAHGNTLDIAGGNGIATAVGATDTVTVNLDISGLTAEATIADDDLVAIYDTSASALRKMTKANFVSGLGGGGAVRTVTAGGNTLASGETLAFTAGSNVTITESGGAVTIASADTNTQLSTEQVQDIVGAMFTSNTETRISATYEDGDGTIDLVVDDMTTDTNTFRTVTAGGNTLGGSETLAFTAGSNITISESGGAVTIASTDTNTQLSQEQVEDFVAGVIVAGSNITKTYDDAAGTLTLASTDTNTQLSQEQVEDFVAGVVVAGSNITKTYDDAAGTLTLASTDTNTQLSSEQVQDIVGAMFSSNTETGIAATYQDADGTIDLVVGTLNQDTTGTAAKVTVTDSNANTNFPVIFHDESNALLDDTGALRYNPSTGTLLVPNLNVAGTTTQVNTVTMEAANAIVFEGATSDAHETTLTITDPTADRTITLPNATGTIALTSDITTTGYTYDATSGSEQFLISDESDAALLKVVQTGTGSSFEVHDAGSDSTIFQVGSGGATSVGLGAGSGIGSDIFFAQGRASAQIWTSSTNGSASAPAFTRRTDLNTGMFFPAGDTLAFATGGTERLRLSSSGMQLNGAYTFPTSDGSANQVLVTDGNGALSFAAQTDTNTQLSTEQVQDIVGAMFGGNTETRITATYQDGDGTIDLVVDDMTADTNTFRTITAGGNTLGSSETLAFTAGSNISISESGGAVTITATDTNTQYSAGTLLDLSSTTFNVDLSEASEAAVAVADDYFLFLDGGATGTAKKEAIADLVAAMAGSNISASNGQLSSLFPSAGTLLDLSGTTLNVDLSEATETAVAVADDYILFLDGGATGATKKESIADLVAAMAGTNLTASNGVLSAAASGEANQNAFSTVAVSGQSNVAADSATDTLTFAAGSNVTITTNASSDTVTIASTDTQYSAGSGLDLSSTTFSVDVSDFMANGANNRVLTATGTDAMNAEANLTFDGSAMTITGSNSATLNITATDGGSSPAQTTFINMTGFENRGQGIRFFDTGSSGEEWFAGLRYAGGFNEYTIGFDQSGGQSEYAANALLTINTNGNVTASAFVGDLTGDVTGTASKATVTDSTANTNFPVVFHDESNGLLDDTGALRYNPSTGTLLVPNLSVSGTTTQVDTVTMEAANAIVFEGATANNFETTLTITDPTADRTITLPDTTGTVALTSDIPTNNNQLTNGAGYTTNTGDITGVTAGTGLTGGGSSGGVTLNVIGGTGITANANDMAITAAQTGIESVLNNSLKIGYGASDAYITFANDNYIDFHIDNANQIRLEDGKFRPAGGNDIALGEDAKRWSTVSTVGLSVGANGSSAGTMSAIQTSSASFSNDDTSLMTSAAIEDKILSYNYTTGMTFVIEDDDGTEVSISNAEEIKFHSGDTSVDINYSDISPGSDADPFDLDFRTIHAPYLKTDDDRDFAPEDLANTIREISGRFSTKTGLEDGSTTNAGDYVDALVLDTFTGHTGGDANLLAFAKNSTKRIYHYRADQDATDWGTASTVAYTSDIPTNNNQLTNGAGFITATLTTEAVQDIVGAMFSSNTETRVSATYQDGDGTIDLVVDDMTANDNTQLSTEQVQDIVGAMVSSNTETNIAVTYDDSGGKLNFASTDTNTTYSAGNGLVLSGTTFKINDPVNLSQLTESTDATTDKILLWDESASLWKYMTLDDLQDSIDTTGGSGTTINNNADNRIITGSGTANTLNAESNLTWDGSTLIVSGGAGDAVLSLRADSDNSGELDQPYIDFMLDGTTIHSSIGHSSDVFHNDSTDNNTLIIANSVATNASGSGIVLATGSSAGHENAVEALRIDPDRKISFNNEYTFPLTDGSANQVLQTNGSGVLSFATVSSGGSSTTGGSKPVVYVDAGNTNVTTTETTIPFDTEVLDPSGNASLSSALGGDGTIRLAAAGYYEISYSIPINDDEENGGGSPDRTRIFAFMQTDDNENWTSPTTVTQSRSQVYTREASGGSGLSTSFIYEHTANDYIRIRIDQQKGTNISTETGQSQISIRLLSTAQDDAFVITAEEGDDYITSEPAAGNANGFFPSYGNGAHNTTKSSSGSDYGIVVPFDCTLHRIDLSFANKGSETNSSNQTITVFKNRSASTTTMTYNASGTSGNAFTKSFSSLSGNGLSYSAGDTFNLRATGLAGYTNTQVGPARMTATFLRTQ